MLRTLLKTAIPGVLLSNPALAQPQQRREAEPQDALAGVRNVVQSAIDQGRIAGAVVHVSQKGRALLVEAFGRADIDRPMATDALFRIASMTKPITSVAVMMLAEEGRLRLDDPLSGYLPEFGDLRVVDAKSGELVPANRAVTIRDLLSHVSGIPYPFMAPESVKADYAAAGLADGLNPRDPTLAENTRVLARLPLAHQPGAAFTYGMNSDVLGRVIEVASGLPLDRFFSERIFGPLKMPDTGFFVPPGKHSRLTALYRPVAGANPPRVEKVTSDPERAGEVVYSAGRVANSPKYLSGGAGLVSTAADYARFLALLLHDGALDEVRILKPESVKAMTTNQIGELSCAFPIHGEKFGLGFGITAKAGDTAPVGSFSWGGIYHTFFWVDPQNEVVAVLMTQLYPWGDSTLWADFQKAVYWAISRGARKAPPAGPPGGAAARESTSGAGVAVNEQTLFGDMECLVIDTPAAKYYYGKRGAGFARILDPEGHDWISYQPGAKAAGEYRGLPKSGQPVKYFHCGYGFGQYATTNPFRTSITRIGPEHVRIESETNDGAAAAAWDFSPASATMTLQPHSRRSRLLVSV